MIRRWNLTIILIISAFVLGFAGGYLYKERFAASSIATQTGPSLEGQLFESHVDALLKPASSSEAITQPSEVYALTGRIQALTASRLTLELPSDTQPDDDTLEFALTADTVYTNLTVAEAADGTRTVNETDLTYSDLNLDDVVTIYSASNIRATELPVLTKVQQLNN